MRDFELSVNAYGCKLKEIFGYASKILVKEYAEAKQKHKAGLQDFNPFTADPNCKTCGKN